MSKEKEIKITDADEVSEEKPDTENSDGGEVQDKTVEAEQSANTKRLSVTPTQDSWVTSWK